MKIYINSNYEILEINSSADDTLTEIDIDRNQVFGSMSDFMILNYCYKSEEDGFIIYPAKKYEMLEMFDKQQNKISILEAENETLKQELSITQDAVNELIFNSLNI